MLGLSFSSKLNWGSYIVYIAKTASKKIGALICFMKFLSREVALYLYKSTLQPCMEYYCHVWASAPSCYLELLDKLQKWICRAVGPLPAAALEPLAHHWNGVVQGSWVQNQWLAPRSIQAFILQRSIKWVQGPSGDLVVKTKLSPHSGSVALRQLNKVFLTSLSPFYRY